MTTPEWAFSSNIRKIAKYILEHDSLRFLLDEDTFPEGRQGLPKLIFARKIQWYIEATGIVSTVRLNSAERVIDYLLERGEILEPEPKHYK